ncbi:hypothetical protein RCL1_005273 [Eukaryota sp. TZLM3-RCL]
MVYKEKNNSLFSILDLDLPHLKMSQESVLALTEQDVQRMLLCDVHLGAKNLNTSMTPYMYKRAPTGHHVINLADTWEKLVLAARIIVAVENPKDVVIVSSSEYGQRAVHKFARFTGASAIAGRWCPGSLTNYVQKEFIEPRVVIVIDPSLDHNAVTESSYVNIPVIGLCNSDSSLRYVDIAVPCNNRSKKSIGLMVWMLCREVLRMRGTIGRQQDWDVMPDLFFHRGEADRALEEQAKAIAEVIADQPTSMPAVAPTLGYETAATTEEFAPEGEWGAQGTTADWAQPVGGDWAAPTTTQGDWGNTGAW